MQNIDLNYILGIESSCDETGIALYHSTQGLVTEILYSQTDLHSLYGGVVPELAARDHGARIMPLIHKALSQAKIDLNQLSGISYCAGPGLAGALLVGATVAKSLGWALQKPTLGIHHLEAHLLSVMLEEKKPHFPFIALLVSGGHTLLVHVSGVGHYQILGESLDDAAGEAFDKTAKLLGLGYPGGAALAQLAAEGHASNLSFPRPLCDQPGLDFSFSGLKTCVSRYWSKVDHNPNHRALIAYAFEEAVVDTLSIKATRALQVTGLNQLVIAGGVSANQRLRKILNKKLNQMNGTLYCPSLKWCTDNGAMIAYAGYLRMKHQLHDQGWAINIQPRWSLSNLSQPAAQNDL